MKCKVAINAQVNPECPGGVETNIISLLATLSKPRPDLSICALIIPKMLKRFEALGFSNVEYKTWEYGQDSISREVPRLARLGWIRDGFGPFKYGFDATVHAYREWRYGVPNPGARKRFDARLNEYSVDVVHFPAPQFFFTDRPFLYEPWDLQYLHYPEFFTQEERDWRDATYRRGCADAALVVTATEWVKKDIVARFGVPSEKIAVIRRGSELASITISEDRKRALLAEAGVAENFIFYPAVPFEHKNHVRLLQALAKLRDKRGRKIQLVLTSKNRTPFTERIEQEVARLGLSADVLFLGRISDEMMSALFRSARFMVFPSLFEGLGLPLLEAFRNNTPVVAAAETCIPEVVGDAGILFNARDVDAIETAIFEALEDPERLARLRPLGAKRLAEFSWEKAGPAFAACYKKVGGVKLTKEESDLCSRLIA